MTQLNTGHELVQDLKTRIPTMKWSTWFSAVDFEIDGQVLRVITPSNFHSQWLSENYEPTLTQVATDHLGLQASVEYPVVTIPISEPSPGSTAPEPDPVVPVPYRPSNGTNGHHNGKIPRSISKYVFDNFIVGNSNRLALAAAKAVSEQPGARYNPLFIYGPAGLGKTHLLHAVSHHTRIMRPGTRIRYTTSESFVNEFIESIRYKRMDEFKQRYRSIDLLLVDDIQFFEGKEQVLEEVFHTFNTLQEADKQMVLSCDRPPKDLITIEERLRSRFTSGLMADIAPPDVETRLAILRNYADLANVVIPDEVLTLIAQNVTTNIRELEGAVNRVAAFASLENMPVTLEMAISALQDILPNTPGRTPTGPEIVSTVASTFNFTVTELEGNSRKQELVLARQVAMYLCRDLAELSYPKIGRLFGDRDHTTCMHAYQKISHRLQDDPQLADVISNMRATLST